MMTSQTHEKALEHPNLGNIKGRVVRPFEDENVVHFRSIPFATVTERFRPCTPLHNIPETFDHRPRADFTEYGNAAPGVSQPPAPEGGRLPGEVDRTFDEWSCLNLTISVPIVAITDLENVKKAALPVMVYIHGGANSEGAGSVSYSHATTRLAALSVEDDMPTIFVSIAYRLNWFGYMTSYDLVGEHKEKSEEPMVYNIGIQDQVVALQWIQNQISGFGGDPTNVTVFGESAGAMSIAQHLAADLPLFRRAILMSGNLATGGNHGMEEHNARYEQLLKYLDINLSTRQERLAALRAVPQASMIQAVRDLHVVPFRIYAQEDTSYNNSLSRGMPCYANQNDIIAKCPWVEDIMIGDDHFEGFFGQDSLPTRENVVNYFDTMKEAFGPDAEAILKQYDLDINDPDMPLAIFAIGSAQLIGDIAFCEPNYRLATALANSTYRATSSTTQEVEKRRKVYRYHMCISNPFLGSQWANVAGHHFIDLLFVFMTLNERFPPRRDHFLARQATEMARKFIRFGNGLAPFDEYIPQSKGGDGKIAILDDVRGWDVRTRKQDEKISKDDPWGKRRYEAMELISKAFDRIADEGERSGQGKVKATERVRKLINERPR